MAEEEITSIETLRERVPAILKQLNAQQNLLLAAAANPLLALEELGYRIPQSLRAELEERIRFSAADRKRLAELRSRIFKIAGESFDVDDPLVLEEVLFKRLKLAPLSPSPVSMRIAGKKEPQAVLPKLAVRYKVPGTTAQPDVLAELSERHPIVAPLIEYREITASQAPFAPRALYDRVRRGDLRGPAFKLQARLQKTRRP
jgi:DNA polymerase I-like protein with 3'-5' exonuclease and polymerase domains